PSRASGFVTQGSRGGPRTPCGNEARWPDWPPARGRGLMGDAAGHNDRIMGQGLYISYRDARLVRDLILDNREWTTDAFRPYAEERRERMRRLRFTATTSSILTAEFGPRAQRRRIRLREELARGNFINPTLAAFLGPEVLPPEAFEEQALLRLRAL